MFKPVSAHQRGFTLIEMSIVLVIIGLIVGGILKGQELIESSRQKNVISQLDRLKADTTTFVDRFKSLPGDFPRVALLPNSAQLTNGNANGVIGAVGADTTAIASNATATADGSENVEYFNHMLAANLGSIGSVTAAAPACFAGLCDTPSALPPSAFPQSGWTIRYGTHSGPTAPVSAKQGHWLGLSRFSTAAWAAASSVVSPERAFQVDNKYDDGIALTGSIRTGVIGTGCGTVGAPTYTATLTEVACHLLFEVN